MIKCQRRPYIDQVGGRAAQALERFSLHQEFLRRYHNPHVEVFTYASLDLSRPCIRLFGVPNLIFENQIFI